MKSLRIVNLAMSLFCCRRQTDTPVEPLYPSEELYGIVGENLKKTFDVRQVGSWAIVFCIYNSIYYTDQLLEYNVCVFLFSLE